MFGSTNHFQSQRPFRPFRLLAGKHIDEFKGRQRYGKCSWFVVGSQTPRAEITRWQIVPLLCFANYSVCSERKRTGARCEVHAGYASSTLDCDTISCFVFVYFPARTHLAHKSTNKLALKPPVKLINTVLQFCRGPWVILKMSSIVRLSHFYEPASSRPDKFRALYYLEHGCSRTTL